MFTDLKRGLEGVPGFWVREGGFYLKIPRGDIDGVGEGK